MSAQAATRTGSLIMIVLPGMRERYLLRGKCRRCACGSRQGHGTCIPAPLASYMLFGLTRVLPSCDIVRQPPRRRHRGERRLQFVLPPANEVALASDHGLAI